MTSPIPDSCDDPDDLLDALRALLVHAGEILFAPAAAADPAQQLLGVVAEEAEQEELLLTRRHVARSLAYLVERRRDVLLALRVGRELHDPLERGVDRGRRRAERSGDEAPQLVHHHEVTARRENVDDRLRRENLADRRRERRPAGLRANPVELREHLVEPVGGALRLQRVVDPGDDAGREVVTRREHGDARDERSDELVADVLVENVGGLPERVDVDPRVEPAPSQRLGERLARDAVQRQCERVDRARDELCAGPGRGERRSEGAATRSLRVDPDGQAARLAERVNELLRGVRLQRAGRIVEEDTHRPELGQHPRPLDQRLDLAGAAPGCRRGPPRSRARRRRSPRRLRAGSRRR